MQKYTLMTPEGMRDTLGNDCKKRRELENTFAQMAYDKGYNEIRTPMFEFYDVFNHGSLNFPQENLYKFTDNKGRLMVLRPDTSLPIARSVATRLRNQNLPLKLFYAQDVFRVNTQNTGKDSCIYQVGAEFIGEAPDSDIINFAGQYLKKCGETTIEIGDIGFFKDLTKDIKAAKNYELLDTLRHLINAKNFPELESLDIDNRLKMLPSLFGGREIFEKAREFLDGERLNNLENLYNKLSENYNVIVDLGLVNTINYYTGIVFKGYIGNTEVLTGGRYDKLPGKFGYDAPAMGFAVNLNELVKVSV